MRLFDQVITAGSRDHSDVLHSVEHGKFSNSRSVTPELVSANHVWDVTTYQEPSKKGFRCLGISTSLQKEVKDRAGLVDGSPKPKFLTTDLDVHLIQEPPGTPTGFPVPQFLGEERCELDISLPERLMADDDTALLKQFLNVALAQWEAVIKPEGILDDTQGEAARRRVRRPFWPRRGGGMACDQSRTVSLPRLTCQNPLKMS